MSTISPKTKFYMFSIIIFHLISGERPRKFSISIFNIVFPLKYVEKICQI